MTTKSDQKSRELGLGQNSAFITHTVAGRSVSGRGCEKIPRTPGKYMQCGQKSLTVSHDRSTRVWKWL